MAIQAGIPMREAHGPIAAAAVKLMAAGQTLVAALELAGDTASRTTLAPFDRRALLADQEFDVFMPLAHGPLASSADKAVRLRYQRAARGYVAHHPARRLPRGNVDGAISSYDLNRSRIPCSLPGGWASNARLPIGADTGQVVLAIQSFITNRSILHILLRL